jgi:4-diphosphocytidyl-2-C-methyl-D-erythritol kinase
MEAAPAKINLALHVRAREPDGYHRIETLFVFAEDGDTVSARDGAGVCLTIGGPFSDGLEAGSGNLVHRAATQLRETFGVAAGVALHLNKQLPVASGIGGGSADAAATLRLLARRWGIDASDPRIAAIARELGADVPACLLSRTVRGDGRGDALRAVANETLAGTPILLINPGVAVPTGPVFAAWDGIDRGPLGEAVDLDSIRAARNDLEAPAIAIAPAIATLLDWLRAADGVTLARMSGSGATCFALFASDGARDRAAAAVATRFPAAWCSATRLR